MKQQFVLTTAILRKDARMLWPIGLLAMVLLTLFVAIQGEWLREMPDIVRLVLPVAAGIGMGFLITSVIHADAPAGTRHEWLTRPIPHAVLLAAKAIFIVIAVLMPVMLGETIGGIHYGYSAIEIVSAATSIQGVAIATFVGLCVIAVISSSALEAAGIAIATLLVAQTLMGPVMRLAGTGEEIYISGASWILDQARVLFALAISVAIFWQMYARRGARQARWLYCAGIAVLILSPLLMPWRLVFAVQRALSPDPAAASLVTLTREAACLPAIVVNPPSATTPGSGDPAWSNNAQPNELSSRQWTERQRRVGGASAIGFETRAAITGPTQGWRTVVARVDAAYVAPDGRVLRKVHPARFTPELQRVDAGTQIVSHFWLIPRDAVDDLVSESPRLSVEYSLGLLRAARTQDLAVDGQRRYLEGFGHCGAQFDRATSSIKVDCYKRGPQPAQVTANLAGAGADREVASDYPDYTPSGLELIGGRRHEMTLRNVPQEDAARVTLTRYEAHAHFARTVESEGLLGSGRLDACPLPQL